MMFLAIDVGNTSTVFAFYDNDKLIESFRIKTGSYSAKEFEKYSYRVDAAAISSVVPGVNDALSALIQGIYGCKVKFLDGRSESGLCICTDNPERVGADIICGAAAAFLTYKRAVIVFDLGTATTVCAVDARGNYLGHSIAPGIRTSFDALHSYTAQLPLITEGFSSCEVIGKNTVSSIKSGVLIGTACFIDGMTLRYREEVGDSATVVITGGLAEEVIPYCKEKLYYHENLLLDGIRMIYNRSL